MKAFTERNPKVIGLIGIVVMAFCILAILFLNRSLFSSGYTIDARFANAAGISKGTDVMVAGVNVGSVTSVARRTGTPSTLHSRSAAPCSCRMTPRLRSKSRPSSGSSTSR